jgi:hypothetical protein
MHSGGTRASRERGGRFAAWLGVFALLALCALGEACSDRENAQIVEPTFTDPCRFFPSDGCSGNGECHGDDQGVPACLCAVGYGDDNCSTCEEGFHLDARGLCVTDRTCAEQPANPCGAYGQCVDASGVLSCRCKPGYGGPRCTLCADGYARAADGLCRPDRRGPRPLDGGSARAAEARSADDASSRQDAGPAGFDSGSGGEAGTTKDAAVHSGSCTSQQLTTLSFDGLAGWPEQENQCNADTDLELPEITLRSRVGSPSAYVWLCASNRVAVMGLSTPHIVLEAGPTQAAQIMLPHGTSSLRFDYAAPESALALELLVDDTRVQMLDAALYGKGTVSLQLAQPTTMIALRSRTEYRQNIAIDNLEYQYKNCD